MPLWVRQTNCPKSGNHALVRMGAKYIPDDFGSLKFLINGLPEKAVERGRSELPAGPDGETHDTTTKQAVGFVKAQTSHGASPESQLETTGADAVASEETSNRAGDFYGLFLEKMCEVAGERPLTSRDIASELNLKKSQVDAWLKQGVCDGQITRSTRPVRYRSSKGEQQKSFSFNVSVD